MSFPSWLPKLQWLCRLGTTNRKRRRAARCEPTKHLRLNLECLEDRLTPSLTSAGEFLAGPYPQAVVAGDFNNDGNLDLVTTNHGDGTVSVLLGDGLGGFDPARKSATGSDPSTVVAADFNNDGHLDLALVGNDPNGIGAVSVLLGNGDGTFQAPITSTNTAPYAAAAVGDFNNDGNSDLVVGVNDPEWDYAAVQVMLGDGHGSFFLSPYATITNRLSELAVGDLNADGRPDVVMGNSSTISVLLGNGDGTLRYDSPAGNFAAGKYPLEGLVIGDFTSDGIPDVVTTSSYTGTVNVLPGRGDGTFAAPIENFAAYTTGDLAVADFDGDGNLDVFTVDGYSGSSALMLGYGSGRFTDPEQGGGGSAVVVGDFNGDGRPDVAMANYWDADMVGILLNDGIWDGSPPPPPPAVPSIAVNDVTVKEGNTGTTAATFTISLSAASSQTVTVSYATGNGTATAGSDYQAASGTLTFAPGETSKTIIVRVNGDRLGEANETFVVNLSSPTNATISDGQGSGTILDDEPRISISDVSKIEGKKNQSTLFTFTVTLSAAYDQPVTMSFKTTDGTAKTSDQDYVAKAGTLTFAPGETTKTITIEVKGDNKKEANEDFFVDLSSLSSYAVFLNSRGKGTILNGD